MENFRFSTTPTVLNRKQSVIRQIQKVFTDKEVRLVSEWLRTMVTAIPPDGDLMHLADDFFTDAFHHPHNRALQLDETLHNLSMAVRVAPEKSTLLMQALTNRADVLISMKEHECAITDLESALSLPNKTYTNESDTFAKIVRCSLAIRNRQKAQRYCDKLLAVQRFQSGQLSELRKSGGSSSLKCKDLQRDQDELDRNLQDFKAKINQMNEVVAMEEEANGAVRSDVPYLGFTPLYSRIRYASVACSLLTSTSGSTKILANRPIPASADIIIEPHPILVELIHQSNGQCDNCQHTKRSLVPCFTCHGRNYCSVECKQEDSALHRYECSAMKSQLFDLIDGADGGRLLLRLVARGLVELNATKDGNCAKSAVDLFEKCLREAKMRPNNDYCNFLALPANLHALNDEDYHKCLMTSLMLSTYMINYTTIVSDLLPVGTLMKSSEIYTFLAAITLLHCAQLNQNAVNFTWTTSTMKKAPTLTTTSDNGLAANLKLISIETINHKIQSYLSSSSAEPTTISKAATEATVESSVVSGTQTFRKCLHFSKEKMKCSVQQRRLKQQSAGGQAEKCLHQALRLFVGEMYKFQKFKKALPEQMMRAVYSTVNHFRHSCDPNVEIMLLPSGIMRAKATRDIRTGEEITISYGVHCKLTSTRDRLKYLQVRHFRQCQCAQCTARVDQFAMLTSFECKSCNGGAVDISNETPPPACRVCGEKMVHSKATINLIEAANCECTKAIDSGSVMTFGDIFNTYLICLVIFVRVWGRFKYDVYRLLLRMASFLTEHNFVYHCLEMLQETFKNAHTFYPTMAAQLFLDYQHMLHCLVQLMHYNFENNLKFFLENRQIFGQMHRLAGAVHTEMLSIADFRGWSSATTTIELNDGKRFLETISTFLENGGAGDGVVVDLYPGTDLLASIFRAAKNNSSGNKKWATQMNRPTDIFETNEAEEEEEEDIVIAVGRRSEKFKPTPNVDDAAIFYNTNISFNWCDDIERDENE